MEATLRKFEPADFDRLVKMYGEFEPKGAFQGLPPQTLAQIRSWLRMLCETGDAQFVVETGNRIVGHSMLCVSKDKKDAEFAIFLHQSYRGLGLGKKLTLGTLNFGCKQLELERVWLSVQGSNPVALRLFEDVGFRDTTQGEPLRWELEMERPSHCARCKEDKCIVFGRGLPLVVTLPRRKSVAT
jgi:RimJ/RimL family protein N-acetyltransferase